MQVQHTGRIVEQSDMARQPAKPVVVAHLPHNTFAGDDLESRMPSGKLLGIIKPPFEGSLHFSQGIVVFCVFAGPGAEKVKADLRTGKGIGKRA